MIMRVSCVRPNIAELVFLLYSRPLHPELFDVFQSQHIHRDEYQALPRSNFSNAAKSWILSI